MLSTLAFIVSLTIPPTPTAAPSDDLCAIALADAPNLEGSAVDYAQACQQDAARERLSLHVVRQGAGLARPAWSFLEMDHQPELDAETLASIGGPLVNPFATDDQADPFAPAPSGWWWPAK